MSPVRGENDLPGDHGPRGRYRDDPQDREISLGTSTILGIFFALAIVCAVFFGFGYTVGRRSVPAAVPAAPAESLNTDSFKSFKPAPGGSNTTPAVPPGATVVPKDVVSSEPGFPTTYPPVPTPAATKTPVAPAKSAFDPDAEIVTTAFPLPTTKPATPRPVPAPQPSQPSTPGPGAIVQISAFHRQEDADMEASELRKKGYNVAIRREPQDSFLHVQLGPYASKKEAEAMRDRLLADGFNAIVK